MAEFSKPVVWLFANLVNQVQIPAAADDFERQAALVSAARQELREALTAFEAAEDGPPPARGDEREPETEEL